MLHYGARCPTRVELSLLHEGLLRFEENLTVVRRAKPPEPLSKLRLGQDGSWILFTVRIVQEGAAQLPEPRCDLWNTGFRWELLLCQPCLRDRSEQS